MSEPLIRSRSLLHLLLSLAVVLACTLSGPSQTTRESFRKMLRADAAFSESDLTAIANGEAVVKVLKTIEKNEVASCGVIRISNVPDLSMAKLVESLTPPEDGTVLSKAGFSSPPVISDLQSLKLEKRDIDDLKKCKVGACKLNLPAAMIEFLQGQINWAAPDVQNQASQLFRQMLLDYVSDYAQRGNDALVQYDNRKDPIRLADEHHILLDRALFLSDLAPEFVDYLEKYPRIKLAGVEVGFNWAKVTFGLEPIITLTDTAKFAGGNGGSQLLLIVTKQIYASRYADSSLAISGLITVSVGSELERYLIFTSRSRSDSLRGILGGIARSLAGSETATRVKDILKRAKTRLEADPKEPVAAAPEKEDKTELQQVLEQSRNPWAIGSVVIVFTALAYFVYRRFRQ